jgi:eukaryotic translation initiation factor 2C
MNALNIVIAKCFGGGVVRTGSNKFFLETGWTVLGNSLDSPLCTIRGYYFSTRPGMRKILLTVNSCTSAFFQPLRLSELMNTRNIELFGKEYTSMLAGLRVFIDYDRIGQDKTKTSSLNQPENRIKRISELGAACNRQKFTWKKRDAKGTVLKEKDITVVDYLKEGKATPCDAESILMSHRIQSQPHPAWFRRSQPW